MLRIIFISCRYSINALGSHKENLSRSHKLHRTGKISNVYILESHILWLFFESVGSFSNLQFCLATAYLTFFFFLFQTAKVLLMHSTCAQVPQDLHPCCCNNMSQSHEMKPVCTAEAYTTTSDLIQPPILR